ncbi:MAG: hypothetical protein CMC15_13960 [Flavobacteriaceae bacterium]|nr:hypothetical protein [Flavobacteriaceae bacterium]|tara:strand:+ start:412 stop:813 length:402 start_codon:yes stop_codon:yes gene_type:complete
MPKKLNDKTQKEWYQMRTRDYMNGIEKVMELHKSNDKDSQMTVDEWKAIYNALHNIKTAFGLFVAHDRMNTAYNGEKDIKSANKVLDDIDTLMADVKVLTMTKAERARHEKAMAEFDAQIAELIAKRDAELGL